MRARLLLLALGLGVIAWALHRDPGYVLLRAHGWVLESSLAGFLLLLTAGLLLAATGLRLLLTLVRLPAILRERSQRRREQRARDSFDLGLRLLLQGQAARAETELARHAVDHPGGASAWLLAARAAQRQQTPEADARRDHYLRQAAQRDDSGAAALAAAELHLERDEWLPARRQLESLSQQVPTHAQALQLLAETLVRIEAWADLARVLESSSARAALGDTRQRALSVLAHAGLLAQAAGEPNLERLRQHWQSAAAVRDHAEVRRAYVRGLIACNAHAEASAQIAQGLAAGWDGDLALLHDELSGVEAVTALAAVERWLTEFGEKPELLWLAGRACRRARLWGKARAHLENRLRLAPSPQVWLELARLAEDSRDAAEAARCYQRGLEMVGQLGIEPRTKGL